MIDDEKIKRINELAKKKKEGTITDEEHEERKALHREYVDAVKSSLRGHLENITVVDAMKPESEWTEEEKAHAAELSNKLQREFEAQNAQDQQMRENIEGNPAKPEGESGRKMIERMNRSHQDVTNWALSHLKHLPEEKINILDVGFGGGAALKNLAERYPEATLYGVDYSETCVETALEVNREEVVEGRMRLHQGSVSELPYGADMFSIVISIESYFFWPDLAHDIKGIVHTMKQGGELVIAAEMYEHEGLTDFDQRIIEKFGLKLATPEQFREMYEAAGLTDVQVLTDEEHGWIAAYGIKPEK